jgi:putative membrane protein insertion efficiency factor
MCAADAVSRETHGHTSPLEADAPDATVSRETPTQPPRNPLSRAINAVLLAPVRAYRRWLSPALPARCKYYPTCSEYAEQALRELGPVKGSIVAAWRVLRCNPLSSGGLDPLDNRRLFRSDRAGDTSGGAG